MKKEITEKDIERLFGKVLELPPIIDDEKVHILLYNAPKLAIRGGRIKHFFKTHLNLMIMSTVVSFILIGTALLVNSVYKQDPAGSLLPKAKTDKSVSQEPVSSQLTHAIKSENNHYTKREITPKEYIQNNVINKPDTSLRSDPLSNWDKNPVSGDEYVLELTNDELKNLGVLLTDSGLYYLNINFQGVISEYNRPYEIMTGGYGKPVTKWVGNSENSISFRAFCVYYSTDYQVTNSNNKVSVSLNKKLAPLYQEMNQRQRFYNRSEKSDFSQKLFSRFDSISEARIDINYSINGQLIKSMNDTLVPVLVQIDKTKPVEQSKILWFVSNNNFYHALPERYSEKVRKFYEHNKLLKKKYPDSNLVDYTKHYQLLNYIESPNCIDLSKEELERIGIKFTDDGMGYFNRQGHHIWSKKFPGMVMFGLRRKNSAQEEFYVLYYSTGGKGFYQMRLGGEEANLVINDLIPIRVKKDLVEGYDLPDDIIFWYTPTEAFFDSLPPRIGEELRNEYKTILIKRDPNISEKVKSQLTSSCKYFEECRATLFNANFTVSPNPVTDNINIDLELQQSDKLSIAVFSINGSKLMSLQPLSDMQAGRHHLTFSAADLSAGIYLLTLQNNKMQFKTQRIIKL